VDEYTISFNQRDKKRKSITQDVKQIWHTAGFKKLLAKRFTNLIYFLEGISRQMRSMLFGNLYYAVVIIIFSLNEI